MLKKCLKYDLQAICRIWWILAATMAGAAAIAAIALRFLLQTAMSRHPSDIQVLLSIFSGLGAGLCFLAMVAAWTVTVILVYWRAYTHFFTDEGYLTFTLPVKRSTLYLSKVLTAAIVQASMTLLFILSLALLLLVVPPVEDGGLMNPIVYTTLGDGLRFLADLSGSGWILVWVLSLLPLLFLTHFFSSGLTFLCITVGSVIAKKHKLLAAIGIYYGVTSVLSFVGQFVFYIFSAGFAGLFDMLFAAEMPLPGISVTVLILIVDLAVACLAAVTHFVTVHLVERKLNLA